MNVENTPTVTNKDRIYLTGFMGSGKSTIGPLLAERLGWFFSDLDNSIVEVIGGPIADYFKTEGEAAFRALEAGQLRATGGLSEAVIAVGGGALCTDDNLKWALENGIVVYIRVPAQELVRRLKADQHTRPMLLGQDGSLLDDKAVFQRISDLIGQREAYYSCAHLTIEAGGQSANQLTQRLGRKLSNFLVNKAL